MTAFHPSDNFSAEYRVRPGASSSSGLRRRLERIYLLGLLQAQSWLQHSMDVRCGDSGMTGGDRNLMQIRDDVARGIETLNRGLLMLVNQQATDFCRLRTQLRCDFGTDVTA
jgi:hypothetical protein